MITYANCEKMLLPGGSLAFCVAGLAALVHLVFLAAQRRHHWVRQTWQLHLGPPLRLALAQRKALVQVGWQPPMASLVWVVQLQARPWTEWVEC